MFVGVLRDVVEGCSEEGYTFEYLEGKGFSTKTKEALGSLTKTPAEEATMKQQEF